MSDRPICPMCEQYGVHPSSDDCAAAFRRAIAAWRRRLPPEVFLARWTAYGVSQGLCARVTSLDPSVKYLGRWVPGFYP